VIKYRIHVRKGRCDYIVSCFSGVSILNM